MGRLYWGEPIDEIGLRERCAPIAARFAGRLPTFDEIRELAAQDSLETATTVLYLSLLAHPRHGPWIAQVRTAIAAAATDTDPAPRPDVKIGVVPGFLYEEFPEIGSGGDIFLQIAKRLGLRAERVPTQSRGLLEPNARILARWIAAQPEERIWLVSLSRGGLEVRLALESLLGESERKRVDWWINMNGYLKGSHLSDIYGTGFARRLRSRLVCAWLRTPFEFIPQNSTAGELCARPQNLPSSLRSIDLVSLPLPQHVPPSLLKRYRQLSPFGPNDTLAVFHHMLSDGGLILPLWGEDHFCRSERMSATITAIFGLLKQKVVI
jgi:hypothetical protein